MSARRAAALAALANCLESELRFLVDLLLEEFEPRAIVERNDARVREFEGLELRTGMLFERVTVPQAVATGTATRL